MNRHELNLCIFVCNSCQFVSKEMVRFGLVLMLVCLVASSILSFTYKLTHPRILLEKEKEKKEALKRAFPQADNFQKGKDYYLAYENRNLIGYILKTTGKGYASSIEILLGIDLKGTLQGVTILEHKETPGLGAKIVEIKYGERQPWFLKQFKGKRAKDLNLKEINTITGATISSRAVLEAVKTKVEEFLQNITN